MKIRIEIPGKDPYNAELSEGMFRIGQSPASHIQIKRDEVSNRHAVLHLKDGELSILDVGSTNGTFVNVKRLEEEERTTLKGQDVIGIGSQVKVTVLAPKPIEKAPEPHVNVETAAADAPKNLDKSIEKVEPTEKPQAVSSGERKEQLLKLSGIRFEYRKIAQQLKNQVHEELLRRVNLKGLTLQGAGADEVKTQALETVDQIFNEISSQIPQGIAQAALRQEIVNEAIGLGAIEALLSDDDITEIMVNGCENIYVEMKGQLMRTDLAYGHDAQVQTAIERIVAPIGRRIDESQPLVDARLADGSRVNAIIPPLAVDGPSLTIRKFAKTSFKMQDLIGFASLTPEMADFLELCVMLRKNIVISGGTGSGKTTMLNVVSNYLPIGERIVTIEDAAELRLEQPHLVRLEARPPNIEGRGEIAIRDLVRNSLRMRPDRIVIGECRGGEALDMLQAMNTGHDGSLTTLHANSSRDALARLETLVLMAGFDLPLRAIREQIASAVAIIVQISRLKDGSRKVTEITEITGMEGEIITSQELFSYVQEGFNEDGKVKGYHQSCGILPTFTEEIKASGLKFDYGVFNREGFLN
ncbi:MAG: Flp pilus assembly complex ATPase component TadA [Lentisphaeria bacterium]|nr:Flp pilus assembly complex ATPase component TadA [Lentisphaeria bacterium]